MYLSTARTAGELRTALRGIPESTPITTTSGKRRKVYVGYGTDPNNADKRVTVVDLKAGNE